MSPADARATSDVAEIRRHADSHRLIAGRRWRVSDPGLDESVRQHLVDELMDARRGVKAALSRFDEQAERLARARVNDAKVALGERGPKWWEPTTADDDEIRTNAFIRSIGDRLGGVDAEQAAALLHLHASS